MKTIKWKLFLSLVVALLMIAAVAVSRDGRILGHELNAPQEEAVQAEQVLADGTVVISTRNMTKDLIGYGGPIPLEIHLRDGRIVEIKTMRNAETPSFLRRVQKSGVYKKWIGMSADEALTAQVDALSGATMTSNVIIKSVQRAMLYAKNVKADEVVSYASLLKPKFIASLVVVLMAAVLPLFIRSKRYRFVQLLLNVLVLGFWSGSFISYSLLVNYMSNGISFWAAVIPILLLVIFIGYPIMGKSNHYCNWVCPFGALQELTGKCTPRKWRISDKVNRLLIIFRNVLWAVLMILMWCGIWFTWMDYELFTAFLFKQSAVAVLVVAALFLLLSLFISRPYCKYVCPTGTLSRIYQQKK